MISLISLLWVLLLPLCKVVDGAGTKSLEWDITYTTANPDSKHVRTVIGVNGKWPLPAIELDLGDRLILKVNNKLDDANTALHAHGLFQKVTNYFDGAAGATQWFTPLNWHI